MLLRWLEEHGFDLTDIEYWEVVDKSISASGYLKSNAKVGSPSPGIAIAPRGGPIHTHSHARTQEKLKCYSAEQDPALTHTAGPAVDNAKASGYSLPKPAATDAAAAAAVSSTASQNATAIHLPAGKFSSTPHEDTNLLINADDATAPSRDAIESDGSDGTSDIPDETTILSLIEDCVIDSCK